MENKQSDNSKKNIPNPEEKPKFNYMWLMLIAMAVLLGFEFMRLSPGTELSSKEFTELLMSGDVKGIDVVNESFAKIYIKKDSLSKPAHSRITKTKMSISNEPYYQTAIGDLGKFEEKLITLQENVPFKDKIEPNYKVETNWLGQIIVWLLPFLLLGAIWFFLMKKMSGGAGGGPGGQIFNIGKSKATLFDSNTKVNVTFKDVAGLDEAKEEIKEIVDFLKMPKKYTALGGKIPKGCLLVGPPGTGKTLLAKAVAGEAEVPFFSISGSDFVEMFVGVGASRVRDLFKKAREKAPCIIFIDEIDAIGRQRGKGAFQGNDERENTLNQLLVEMDGFSTDKGVIIIGATNRADILDNALLRAGRFDRQIGIGRPDLNGREQIFNVHLREIKKTEEVNAKILAEMTPGFVGADIANVCNEAALVAARRNKTQIDMDDFNHALDRVIGGLEKRTKLIAPSEKKIIAFHEAGHAICGWFLEHAYPLVKVTIVPRGLAALGYAQYLPSEQNLQTTEEILDQMCMTLGGRAAEEVIFGRVTTGAQNDLDKVTNMAYGIVAIYGMNEKVGNVSFYEMSNRNQFARPYSEETAALIDDEVRKIINIQFERAKALLREKHEELDKLANALIEREMLVKSDVEKLIGHRPFGKDSVNNEAQDAFQWSSKVEEPPLTPPAPTA